MEMILENVDEWMKMDETEWSAKGWIRRENGQPGHKNLSSNETHTFGSEMSFLNVWVEIHVDFLSPFSTKLYLVLVWKADLASLLWLITA